MILDQFADIVITLWFLFLLYCKIHCSKVPWRCQPIPFSALTDEQANLQISDVVKMHSARRAPVVRESLRSHYSRTQNTGYRRQLSVTLPYASGGSNISVWGQTTFASAADAFSRNATSAVQDHHVQDMAVQARTAAQDESTSLVSYRFRKSLETLVLTLFRMSPNPFSRAAQPITLTKCIFHGSKILIQFTSLGEHIF